MAASVRLKRMRCSMEVKAMLKKTIIFVCMLVLGIISILIFSPHVWAFYTSVLKDPYGSAAEVEVTSIIGYQGTSWTYLVKNINVSPFINLFRVNLPDSVTVKSSQCPPNFYIYGVGPWWPQCYTWSTYIPGNLNNNPGIPPGSTGIFSFQTAAPAMMNFSIGYAHYGYIDTDGTIIGPYTSTVNGFYALITEVSGVATITRGTTTTPAVAGTTIVALDKVQTGPDGSAHILFPEGSEVVLQGNSMFSIGGCFGLHSWIVNEIGKIWNNIAPNADNNWNIDTPNCAVGDRGTTFWIDADQANTTVSVQSGSADVANLTGGVLRSITSVPAGRSFRVSPSPAPWTLLLLSD
jgi:hypothetical protein